MNTFENDPPRPCLPYVNLCLLVLIFLVYTWELSLGPKLAKVVRVWGFTPAHLTGSWRHPGWAFLQSLLSLFSA